MDTEMNLGEKIRRVRLTAGLSQKEVAQKSEITVSFLSQIERDKATPSLKSLKNISCALGIRINQLFDEDISTTKRIKVFKKNTNQGFILENGEGLNFRLD